jgi:hypothetical protein
MKFSDLIGKRLIGFQSVDEDECDISDTEVFQNKHNKYGESMNVRLQLFFGDNILNAEEVFLVCDNRFGMWSWFSNWRLVEKKELFELKEDESDKKIISKINKSYKSIGEKIKSIDVDFKQDLNTDNIDVDEDEWDEKFPDGKDEENYYYLKLNTDTKILALGTQYHDCHYPDTIWNFI